MANDSRFARERQPEKTDHEKTPSDKAEEIFGVEEQQWRRRNDWVMMTATLSASLALVLLSVIALTRRLGSGRALLPGRLDLDDPLRIVDEMFASGEIDLKDYQARRAQLRKLERSG
jgi:hypothetical protein